MKKKLSAANGILRLVYRKYPELVRTMENRHRIYNETVHYIEDKAAKGEILLLRPEEKLPIKRMCKDPDILQNVYDTGRNCGMQNLSNIKAFLQA